IRKFDTEKAYQYAVNSCERFGNGTRGYAVGDFGFSQTMEYANDDWNLSRMASALGKEEDAAKYARRSRNYTNLFDADAPWTYDKAGKEAKPEWKGWFHGKDGNGRWLPWHGLTSDRGVQEATLYEQGWFVPFDVPGLIQLLGG